MDPQVPSMYCPDIYDCELGIFDYCKEWAIVYITLRAIVYTTPISSFLEPSSGCID